MLLVGTKRAYQDYITCKISAVYLKRSDCNGRRKLEGKKNTFWEKLLQPRFSKQVLVNFEIFKLLLNLSFTHLRAQIACYE